MSFKIGDRVRVTCLDYFNGEIGVVNFTHPSGGCSVEFANQNEFFWDDELEKYYIDPLQILKKVINEL